MKPALGRNLGTLLGGQPAGAPATSEGNPVPQPGPGVRSLLRGQPPAAVTAEPSPLPAPAAKEPARAVVPNWYFFGADLLLTSLALVLFCTHMAKMGWGPRIFYMALVAFGGCLGAAGVWFGRSKDS